DSFQGGTNTTHFVSTGYLPQTSTTGGDAVNSAWTHDDSVASPIGDGSSMPVTWNADCSSQISSSASIGALHAYCRAVQEITPFSVSYSQTDTNGDSFENTSYNPLIATAHATMGVSAQDSVTVVSKTLPAGTIVQVRLGLAVDCGVATSGGGTGSQVTAQTYCQVHNGASSYNTDTLNFNSQYDGNGVNTNEVFGGPLRATPYAFHWPHPH